MKKAIAIALLTMATITGCSKVEVITNIEDFYLQSIIEQTKELFEFAYRDGKLKFYTDEYDENKTDIIEGRYNKEERAYVIIPNEVRVVSESLYGIEDKVVTMKLNKDEKINLEINTEKEIGKPVSITLMDLSKDKVIFEEEIDAKSKNTISTEQVDKDGEYKLVFDIDNIDNYNIKISAMKIK